MDPITHALSSLALSRAGLNKASRLAAPMLLAAGLAADVDEFSSWWGAESYLHAHRTATHSLLGTVLIAAAVAACFWRFGRSHPTQPVRFFRAFVLCAVAAGFHLLLDWLNPYGVKLLWPLRQKWYAADTVARVDLLILILLFAALLLPGLFRLVLEEIGTKAKRSSAQRGAIYALCLIAVLIVARWSLHDSALQVLRSRLYFGQSPVSTAAFPQSASPLQWNGVVETDNTIQEIEVSLSPNARFDPDLAHINYKPESSPALEAARKSRVLQEYLGFARFPKATVFKQGEGYRVELRDLRFGSYLPFQREVMASVELNAQYEIIKDEFRFGPAR